MSEPNHIPRHIAIIMDGNGRWAQSRGQDRLYGHRNGVGNVRNAITRCMELGVGYLTLYVFSAENWGRPQQEVDGLMQLMFKSIEEEIDELAANGVRVRIIGDMNSLSPAIARQLREAEARTADGKALTVQMAFNYGSRDELAHAARMAAEAVKAGKYAAAEITPEKLGGYLYTAGCPDPDLLIRTGGECRLSNFLLWQVAYAELYFTDTFWPDFGPEELDKAVEEYGRRERRFGRLNELDEVNTIV